MKETPEGVYSEASTMCTWTSWTDQGRKEGRGQGGVGLRGNGGISEILNSGTFKTALAVRLRF